MSDLKVRGRPSLGVDTKILIPMNLSRELKVRAQRAAREQHISMAAWIRAAMTAALEGGTVKAA